MSASVLLVTETAGFPEVHVSSDGSHTLAELERVARSAWPQPDRLVHVKTDELKRGHYLTTYAPQETP